MNSCGSGATQSGALGLYCLSDEEAVEGVVLGASVVQHSIARITRCKVLPGVGFLGLNIAAFAALGEIPGVFVKPLTVREEGVKLGVKLGESTLNLFLTLQS